MRRTFAPGAAGFLAVGAAALLGVNTSATIDPAGEAAPGTVRLRLLGVNDLHGHLERGGRASAAWRGSRRTSTARRCPAAPFASMRATWLAPRR